MSVSQPKATATAFQSNAELRPLTSKTGAGLTRLSVRRNVERNRVSGGFDFNAVDFPDLAVGTGRRGRSKGLSNSAAQLGVCHLIRRETRYPPAGTRSPNKEGTKIHSIRRDRDIVSV